MKTLMQQINRNGRGYKKAKVWNMAQFQPRRWKEAQAILSTTPQDEPVSNIPQTPPPAASSYPSPEPTPEPQLKHQPDPVSPAGDSVLSDQIIPAVIPSGPSRTGKVARLPEDVRFEVNHLLRHNLKYSDICQKLAELGHPEITPQNISNWKNGGFIDWYREQQEREARLAPLKALERCTRAVDIDLWQQNAVALAAEKFTAIMGQFSHSRALEALYEKPELLPKYIAAMTALSRCTTELAKGFAISQDREAILRQQLNLSPSGRNPIEEDDD
jgi:hypothetical protein